MLLIHGMWSSPIQWNEFINYFKDREIKAVAIEYKKKNNASFMDYVKEVAKVARGEIIIGHSMGGLIVQKVAEMVDIRAGIAIGSAPPRGIKFNNIGLTIHALRYLPSIIVRKPFTPSYKFVRKYLLNCVDEKRARQVYESLLPESPIAAYEIFMNKIDVDANKIKSPLFFMAGKNDKVAPPELEEKIAKKYNAKLSLYEGCHWIFDNPYEIGRKIIKFIGEI